MKRASVLVTLFMTACAPLRYEAAPTQVGSCDDPATSAVERADWRATQQENTRSAYQVFLAKHPRSCYAPLATAKLKQMVRPKPVIVRKLPETTNIVAPPPAAYQ